MTEDWTARIAGIRMQLDGEFADRVQQSSLTAQQWSLVMTATEFEIENPQAPEDAGIVTNTDNLPAVASEMDRVQKQGMGNVQSGGGSGGILGKIIDRFKREAGSSVDLDEAGTLAEEYGRRLQEKLIEQDRWEEVCAVAAGE
jgi:hypothetical protein